MKPAPFYAWGAVPSTLPPSVPVVHLDQAASLAGFCSVLALAASVWLACPSSMAPVAFVRECFSLHGLSGPIDEAWRCGVTLAATAAAGTLSLIAGLRPVDRILHISGPRLLHGRVARKEAERIAGQERGDRSPFLHLAGIGLDKTRCTRAAWIFGSVGSGKSVILYAVAAEAFDKRVPTFICDMKGGDFVQRFGDRADLLSPWDRRSKLWAVAEDVRTHDEVSVLAQALIPTEVGSNRFWSDAAQQLVVGSLLGLIREKGRNWGWGDLAARLVADRPAMLAAMERDNPKAAALIAEAGATSSGLMATLATFTRPIDDLARAWPDPPKTGEGWCIRRWIALSTKQQRRVIVCGGPDPVLTRGYIGALFELAARKILALPDDEHGRSLVFLLDELTALGRLPSVQALIDKGRSKGCSLWLATQAPELILAAYGADVGDALMSMSGTTIVCRMQASDGLERVAARFGKSRIGIVGLSSNAADGSGRGSTNTSMHEENRSVVSTHDIAGLGVVKGKKYKNGYAVRALVRGLGIDALELDFPGADLPKVAEAFVPARWTRPIEQQRKQELEEASASGPDVGDKRHELLQDALGKMTRGIESC